MAQLLHWQPVHYYPSTLEALQTSAHLKVELTLLKVLSVKLQVCCNFHRCFLAKTTLVQSSNQGSSVESSPMDLLVLAMGPHQVVQKSQGALLAHSCHTLGSSQCSTAQVALALPCHFQKPSQLAHWPLHRGVWCRTWTHWYWIAHPTSSGIQDSLLNLLTHVTEIF